MSTTCECVNCHERFAARYGYETRCIPCWLRYKYGQGAAQPRVEIRYVRVEVPDPRLPDLEDWEEMLRRLVVLCHPDRHGGSRLSTEATSWLLEQRKRLQTETEVET
jgi:hypothetical protein